MRFLVFLAAAVAGTAAQQAGLTATANIVREDPFISSVGDELRLGAPNPHKEALKKTPVVGSEEGVCSKTCICMMRELSRGVAAFDGGLETVNNLEEYCALNCCDAQEFLMPDRTQERPCRAFARSLGVPGDYSVSRRVCMRRGAEKLKEFNRDFDA
eukprot:TRINITY_DN550_c0_g1_i1.p1 TRINITY_DN550_c0_g1~~TRINITY_DN550_c0_g1_i1.p1  ORF type:complete len:170 (-),score=55.94 TRINITY_DN550_c0_g1_i1:10-480(-)